MGVEANSAETYATDIAMNADTKHISSSGTGTVDAKAGLYVGDADVLSSANTDGGSASSTGEEASLLLDSTAKDTGARTSLDGLGDAVAGSKGVVDLVRNIFTRSQTELSGTSYSSGTVKRLIGRSKDKGVWANAAALGGAVGANLSAWGRLRNELRAPRGQNADLYQRIAGSAMKASEKQRLTRELDLANQMSSLNRFLGSTGAIGQACIRSLLEREGQSLYSGGDKKMVGSQYHWPAGSEALKARYEKVPGQVAALQKAIPGLLQEESQETGTTRIKTLQGVVARVVRDFEKARDAHWAEHPEAHADMLAKLRPHRVKVGRILRRFIADHDKRWNARDMSREEDGEVLESRDEQADSRVQAEADERARVDAEEAELRRQYAEDMQNKLRRCNDRCRGFKARERALFKEIRGKWFNKDQRTLCLTSLATMYDGWMGTLKEYRRLYETAQWPAASRNISPKGATNRRNRRLEPNYSGLMKLWQEVFGNTDNNLLYRVRTY